MKREGHANARGFDINIEHQGGNIHLSTTYYRGMDKFPNTGDNAVIIIVIFFVSLFFLMSYSKTFINCLFGAPLINNWAILLILPALGLAALLSLLCNKDWVEGNRWHSCEHKVLAVIEKKHLKRRDIGISLNTLKKQSRLAFSCGTTKLNLILVGSLIFGYTIPAVPHYIINNITSARAWINVSVLMAGLFCLLLAGSYLSQLVFFTAKPREEQYQEALRVAKEIERMILKNRR